MLQQEREDSEASPSIGALSFERSQHAPQRLPPENVVHDGTGPAPVVLEHAGCVGPHEARQELPLLSLEICAIAENSVNSALLQLKLPRGRGHGQDQNLHNDIIIMGVNRVSTGAWQCDGTWLRRLLFIRTTDPCRLIDRTDYGHIANGVVPFSRQRYTAGKCVDDRLQLMIVGARPGYGSCAVDTANSFGDAVPRRGEDQVFD